MMGAKTVDYYMRLPYHIELIRDGEHGYFAHVKELHGCIVDGETIEKAAKNISHAMRAYFNSCIKHGDKIPKPEEEE